MDILQRLERERAELMRQAKEAKKKARELAGHIKVIRKVEKSLISRVKRTRRKLSAKARAAIAAGQRKRRAAEKAAQ